MKSSLLRVKSRCSALEYVHSFERSIALALPELVAFSTDNLKVSRRLSATK